MVNGFLQIIEEKVKLDSSLPSPKLVPTSHALDPEPQSLEGGASWNRWQTCGPVF